MLKIKNIKPLGESAFKTLATLHADFLANVKKDHNPFLLLTTAIDNNQINPGDGAPNIILNLDQRNCLIYLRDNFDNIIFGIPAQLETVIGAINNDLFGSVVKKGFATRWELNRFGKGVYNIFGYDAHFRSQVKKGIWLAKQLNIKSCPYCNAQYTLIVDAGSKGHIAKFQFDHFFSKKRYPYLSISLYNLVPSCAPCNLSKGDQPTSLATHYHPYYNNIAEKVKFKVVYPIDLKKLTIGKIKSLPLTIIFSPKYAPFAPMVQLHNETYHIEAGYQRHTDIVEDLLCKAVVNNSSFKKDIMAIKGLFDGDEKLYKRYLLGNYALQDEVLERPLAKFTQDIARQFEII